MRRRESEREDGVNGRLEDSASAMMLLPPGWLPDSRSTLPVPTRTPCRATAAHGGPTPAVR